MNLLLLAISLFVLGSVALFVLAIGKREARSLFVEARLKAFREEEKVVPEEKEGGDAFRQKQNYSGIPLLSSLLAGMRGSEALALQLERAGVPLRVGEFYMIRVGAAGARDTEMARPAPIADHVRGRIRGPRGRIHDSQ